MKLIITLNDPTPGDNYGGILQKNLIDFLMLEL